MCQAVQCEKCGRPGWRGCGAHVEQVLAHVPKAERCKCEGGAKTKSVGDMIRDLFGAKR
jgi:hypothetical protein